MNKGVFDESMFVWMYISIDCRTRKLVLFILRDIFYWQSVNNLVFSKKANTVLKIKIVH